MSKRLTGAISLRKLYKGGGRAPDRRKIAKQQKDEKILPEGRLQRGGRSSSEKKGGGRKELSENPCKRNGKVNASGLKTLDAEVKLGEPRKGGGPPGEPSGNSLRRKVEKGHE